MKPFFVYILRCSDGSLYAGRTDALDERIHAHDAGTYGGYTCERRPLRLVYVLELATRIEALELELRIKGWTRAKKEASIAGDWAAVKRLARGLDRHERAAAAALRLRAR